MRDFGMGHVASELHPFISCLLSALLRAIHLVDFATQLTAVLRARFLLLSCHKFLSLCLCFNKRSKPGRSFFRSESVTLLVDNLHAAATKALTPHSAL
jgi:hypothetical protein